MPNTVRQMPLRGLDKNGVTVARRNRVEWSLESWRPQDWQGIDQPPVFLEAFQPGDAVLALVAHFVTTWGVSYVGSPSPSPFALELIAALFREADGASLDLDLESRDGGRVSELRALIEAVGSAAAPIGAQSGRWVVTVGDLVLLREFASFLIGSNLDYQFTLGSLRLVERDASIILIAGPEGDVAKSIEVVMSVATATDAEFVPEAKP